MRIVRGRVRHVLAVMQSAQGVRVKGFTGCVRCWRASGVPSEGWQVGRDAQSLQDLAWREVRAVGRLWKQGRWQRGERCRPQRLSGCSEGWGRWVGGEMGMWG